jgi:hypothetical protein
LLAGYWSLAEVLTRSTIVAPAITNIAAVLDTLRVVMRPVHEAPEVVPFVHSANLHSVSDANRHAFGEVNVVGDKQRFAIANIEDKSLVPGTVVVIRQQPYDDTPEFDPGPRVRFLEAIAQTMPFNILVFLAVARRHKTATRNAASHRWLPRFFVRYSG